MPTPRTKVKRVPQRGAYDRDTIHAILDEAPICHVGIIGEGGQPFVLPTLHARLGDELLLHGSSASRMLRTAAAAPVCVTVTLVDGMVLARSAFHHSMNYRSVVLLGEATRVEGDEAKTRALEAFTEKLIPGRWPEVRWPSRQELKGTQVLSLTIDEASAKVRTGGPVDDEPDYDLPVWAGVIPLTVTAGAPIADPNGRPETPVPGYVQTYTERHGPVQAQAAA
jgi:nitroimidazol reductase NimA-like FMN-containing flavoprotein (pyridoxamine 5'-phosphate oxidase superfamily)